MILYISSRSPRFLLISRVVRFRRDNLVSYGTSLRLGMRLVALSPIIAYLSPIEEPKLAYDNQDKWSDNAGANRSTLTRIII